jgi:hypothetical protein
MDLDRLREEIQPALRRMQLLVLRMHARAPALLLHGQALLREALCRQTRRERLHAGSVCGAAHERAQRAAHADTAAAPRTSPNAGCHVRKSAEAVWQVERQTGAETGK